MLRILTLVLFLRLFSATVSSETMSYARVSKNGQQVENSYNSYAWINRLSGRNNMSVENENRSINDIVITVSPVYVSPKTPRLKKGESVDHSMPIIVPKYSTLDHEMITKLDTASKKQIQQRFHPPAIFEHSVAHERPQKGASVLNMENSPSMNSSTYPGPIFSGMYEYNPSDFIDDEPPASVITKYSPMPTDTRDKIPDTYKPSPNKYHDSDEHEANYPNFDFASSYGNDGREPKPIRYSNHDHSPPSEEIPYDHHDLHHDIVYDHIPEYYVHHPKTTTEEPEMNDQRLDKRPYSYYFIGKKLWYIPLYFSIYFVIYIAALVLKSIARHKINFPAHLAEAAAQQKRSEPSEGWRNFAGRILEGAERFSKIYNKGSPINIR